MQTNGNVRRWFLSSLTLALLGAIGLVMAIPALAYIGSPLRRKRHSENPDAVFLDVGPIADVPLGVWRLLTLEMVQENGWEKTRMRRAVWVHRQGESDRAITVLSPICPHLGCPINWHPAQKQFHCPCHGGLFDARGQLAGGPPPRGMDPLEFQVRAGRLFVHWQDFKIGVAQRVAVDI